MYECSASFASLVPCWGEHPRVACSRDWGRSSTSTTVPSGSHCAAPRHMGTKALTPNHPCWPLTPSLRTKSSSPGPCSMQARGEEPVAATEASERLDGLGWQERAMRLSRILLHVSAECGVEGRLGHVCAALWQKSRFLRALLPHSMWIILAPCSQGHRRM